MMFALSFLVGGTATLVLGNGGAPGGTGDPASQEAYAVRVLVGEGDLGPRERIQGLYLGDRDGETRILIHSRERVLVDTHRVGPDDPIHAAIEDPDRRVVASASKEVLAATWIELRELPGGRTELWSHAALLTPHPDEMPVGGIPRVISVQGPVSFFPSDDGRTIAGLHHVHEGPFADAFSVYDSLGATLALPTLVAKSYELLLARDASVVAVHAASGIHLFDRRGQRIAETLPPTPLFRLSGDGATRATLLESSIAFSEKAAAAARLKQMGAPIEIAFGSGGWVAVLDRGQLVLANVRQAPIQPAFTHVAEEGWNPSSMDLWQDAEGPLRLAVGLLSTEQGSGAGGGRVCAASVEILTLSVAGTARLEPASRFALEEPFETGAWTAASPDVYFVRGGRDVLALTADRAVWLVRER